MKILQINKYFYKKGGADTVFLNTIDLLSKNGHEVVPFSLLNTKNLETPYSHYFVDYPELSATGTFTKIKKAPGFFYNKAAAAKLEELIEREKPDIAHIHLMFNSLSISILPILKKYNIPTVMSVHDYRLICPAYTFKNGHGEVCEKCKTRNFFHCILSRCSNNNLMNSLMLSLDMYFRECFYPPVELIDKFIFVSKFAMNKHISINPKYKDKSTFLYNFTPSVNTQKKGKGEYMLFFGRISQEKGIQTLLSAIKKTPSITLKLAGMGPLEKQLKSECPKNAEFIGYKSGKVLQDLIMNASFVIVPSEWYENNPMTIIESFTIGTPVIGTNIGGIPELIDPGKTGYICETNSVDSLSFAISKANNLSDQEYLEMCNNCKDFALNNFSENSHYKRLIDIYKQTLKEAKS